MPEGLDRTLDSAYGTRAVGGDRIVAEAGMAL
jgi:hypothetical protein